MAPVTIFTHIPKACGSTLQQVLMRQTTPGHFFSFGSHGFAHGGGHRTSLAAFRQLSASEKLQLDLILGHLAYGIHELMPQPSSYLTMLREPIERVISLYNYLRNSGLPHPLQPSTRTMTLHDFVQSSVTPFTRNCQTRLLAGDCSWRGWENELGRKIPEKKLLPTAKRNLLAFAAVGLAERFDESIALYRSVLGWAHCGYSRANETRGSPQWPLVRREELDDQTLRAIQDNNQLDLELYSFATGLFIRQLARHGLANDQRLSSELRRISAEKEAFKGDAISSEIFFCANRLREAGTFSDAETATQVAVVLQSLYWLAEINRPTPSARAIVEFVQTRTQMTITEDQAAASLAKLQATGMRRFLNRATPPSADAIQ